MGDEQDPIAAQLSSGTATITLEPEVVPDPEPELEEDGQDGGDPPEDGVRVEDLDPDEELWPGGPQIKQIIEWKEAFGDVYVTSLTLDKHVVWRTMDRTEYKRMIKAMEQMAASGQLSEADIKTFNEEYITEVCTLFPKYTKQDMAIDLAGLPTIISQEVMEASGFVALEVRQL